jgi:hypothetical protein
VLDTFRKTFHLVGRSADSPGRVSKLYLEPLSTSLRRLNTSLPRNRGSRKRWAHRDLLSL